jgi:hypothetical protein
MKMNVNSKMAVVFTRVRTVMGTIRVVVWWDFYWTSGTDIIVSVGTSYSSCVVDDEIWCIELITTDWYLSTALYDLVSMNVRQASHLDMPSSWRGMYRQACSSHTSHDEYPAVSVSCKLLPGTPPPNQCDHCLTWRQPIRGLCRRRHHASNVQQLFSAMYPGVEFRSLTKWRNNPGSPGRHSQDYNHANTVKCAIVYYLGDVVCLILQLHMCIYYVHTTPEDWFLQGDQWNVPTKTLGTRFASFAVCHVW